MLPAVMDGTHKNDATYRADIDGLRAVAVLAVVGFHAGIRAFAGGYVGVDIFFVISGFLITSIICRHLENGNFTFWDFYARRAKRIFPALVMVLLAVCAYGWFILLPDEFERLGKHIAAGAGFISNFALWKESGYFDKSAEAKPLLHLWSLGIEEQFYLLWPPVLVWAWKRKANVLRIAIGIVSISFAANVIMVSLWQASDMYYLPPIRFWELLLGGALGYASLFRPEDFRNFLRRALSFVPRLKGFSVESVASVIGLLLILIAVFALNETLLFPGWWALLPTVGTALLISAGPAAWINRTVLSSRPLVFVGLISYPLYLWHWPLLSFAHIVEPDALSWSTAAAAVILAFVLAWLTFRIVEKPLRAKPNRWAIACVSGLVVVACLGMAVFADRVNARSQHFGFEKIFDAAKAQWPFPGPGLRPVPTALISYYFERGTASSKVFFMGDSHVQQYYPRIDHLLTEHPNRTKSVVYVSRLGCPPVSYFEGLVNPKCKGLKEHAIAIAEELNVDTVVLAAGWYHYAAFDLDGPDDAYRDLAATIARFHNGGRRVYLILPIPRGEAFAPSHLVKRSFGGSGFTVVQHIDRREVDRWVKPIATKLRQIATSAGAIAIDPVDSFCSASECPTFADDGLPIYFDESHLRPDYVREHVTYLDEIVLMGATRSGSAMDSLGAPAMAKSADSSFHSNRW